MLPSFTSVILTVSVIIGVRTWFRKPSSRIILYAVLIPLILFSAVCIVASNPRTASSLHDADSLWRPIAQFFASAAFLVAVFAESRRARQ